MNSTEEHVKQGGANCPFCDSEETEGDSFDVVGICVDQSFRCLECDGAWLNEYRLVSFAPTEMPETN